MPCSHMDAGKPFLVKIAAHHAYLSSSAVGDDCLLHTSMLYRECGMFGLANSVPSLCNASREGTLT